MGKPTRSHVLKGKGLSLPQEAINCQWLLCQWWGLVNPFPTSIGTMTGLIQCRSCASSHWLSKFMSGTALLCPEHTFFFFICISPPELWPLASDYSQFPHVPWTLLGRRVSNRSSIFSSTPQSVSVRQTIYQRLYVTCHLLQKDASMKKAESCNNLWYKDMYLKGSVIL